jgi:hypothetical protein
MRRTKSLVAVGILLSTVALWLHSYAAFVMDPVLRILIFATNSVVLKIQDDFCRMTSPFATEFCDEFGVTAAAVTSRAMLSNYNMGRARPHEGVA